MNFMNKLKEKKTDNKGFSLVELIIVIAIMAILVGVVGTQVIPYLNRSREAKDLQILSAYSTAAVSAYSMKAEKIGNTKVIVTVDASDTTDDITADDAVADLVSELAGYDKLSDITWSSQNGKDLTAITITIDPANSKVTVEATNFDTVTSYI